MMHSMQAIKITHEWIYKGPNKAFVVTDNYFHLIGILNFNKIAVSKYKIINGKYIICYELRKNYLLTH